MVVIGTHRVQRYEAGSGKLPVVILHGAGDSASSWLPVLRRLAASGRAVSYDRPGLGSSPSGPPPTLERYLAELHEVVAQEPSAPVILVGHSLGGLIAQVFAARHPGMVAGLVLVDATPDAIADEPAVRAGFRVSGAVAALLRAGAPWGLVRLLARIGALPMYPEHGRYRQLVGEREYRRWIRTVEQSFSQGATAELRSVLPAAESARLEPALQTETPFGELPLAVVSSRAYGEKWTVLQRGLAKRSRRGFLLETGDRYHNVQLSRPELVVAAIEQVREQLGR